MRKLSFGIVIAIGLTVLIWALWPTKAKELAIKPAPVETPATTPKPIDNRIALLDSFFKQHNCPEPYYATNYIQAADQAGIDYRLLPGISVLESSCGQHTAPNSNNLWGWNSGKAKFPSVAYGINYVSFALTKTPYGTKTLKQKLKIYNSVNPKYYNEITSLMSEISH